MFGFAIRVASPVPTWKRPLSMLAATGLPRLDPGTSHQLNDVPLTADPDQHPIL